MRKLIAETSLGSQRIRVPENWNEVTVEQFQRLVKEYDGKDWIKLFSILANQEYDYIYNSTDSRIEATIYQTIEYFLYNKIEFEKLEMPGFIMYNSRQIEIPKKLGKLSIGQNIQARQSLAEMKDLKEGISIMTAIYLQPIIDKKPFDHLRAIEIEQDVLKMSIVAIFPVGFFLLKRMKNYGNWLTKSLNLLKQILTRKGKGLLK
jgi:hypothetical protein